MVGNLMSYSPFFFNQNAKGSSRATQAGFQNGSGSTILQSTPVSVNTSSQTLPLDVTSEASVQAIVGLAGVDTPNGASASVIDNGRLENITTSFSVGDAVYAGISTPLINVKPDIGVAGFASGDFVVFIGVVVKNEFNPSLLDLKLMISVIGQL
jgi:hypothetical protein